MKEEKNKPVPKEDVKEDQPVDTKQEETLEKETADTKNKEGAIKKEETVEKDLKVETEEKKEKFFHMEMAMVMDNPNEDDICKDSMEVIGDSLKIKELEDEIENILTTRTQVKDTQKRILVLQSILSSLQK